MRPLNRRRRKALQLALLMSNLLDQIRAIQPYWSVIKRSRPTPIRSFGYPGQIMHKLDPAAEEDQSGANLCLKQSPPMSFAQLKSKISAIRI